MNRFSFWNSSKSSNSSTSTRKNVFSFEDLFWPKHDFYLNVIVNSPKIFYGIEGRYRTAVIFPLFAFFIFKKPKGPSEWILNNHFKNQTLLIITGFEGDVYDLIQRWARLFFGYCQWFQYFAFFLQLRSCLVCCLVKRCVKRGGLVGKIGRRNLK